MKTQAPILIDLATDVAIIGMACRFPGSQEL